LNVSKFPALFAEFRGKRFSLLWRGSRDGFRAGDFHSRCDGHPSTLTLIKDSVGNIFGGFTPVEWESREYDGANRYKADPSLKSFRLTLKNPHNFPARKFALTADMKDEAIFCDSSWGPNFCDIAVQDSYSRDNSAHRFGRSYENDTGLDGKTFLTGSEGFTVKEIEVFEITD
jgi:hypothetical protein